MGVKEKYNNYKIKANQPLSNQIMTIPNILSLVRIVLITPFVVFFINKQYLVSVILIVVSGLTDWFDGWIARNFNQMSELGKILDPLADKLTLVAVGICMIFLEPFASIPMGIMVVKDLLMLIGGTIIIKRGIIPPNSKWYGKLGTFMFYLTVGYIVLTEIIGYVNPTLTIILLSATSAIMVFALISYIIMFFEIIKDDNEKKTNSEKANKPLESQFTSEIPAISKNQK